MSGCSAGSFLSFHSDGSLRGKIVHKTHRVLQRLSVRTVFIIVLILSGLRSYSLLSESRPGLVREM